MPQTPMRDARPSIISVKDLEVHFRRDEGVVRAVNGVSFDVYPGEALGIVGESGCGKTMTAYALMRILPRTGHIPRGEILYSIGEGEQVDLASVPADGEVMRGIRGGEMAMIFQEPMTALSPVHTVSNQISEAILLHEDVSKEEARSRVVQLLKQVGIPRAEESAHDYPFQLSGGMRQRAVIAMALACHPKILIADEPTTALDVTLQAQVLGLVRSMQEAFGLSLILITHDLAVVSHMVKRVCVMYLGHIIEEGPVDEVFDAPSHPYTRALMRSIPRVGGARERLTPIEGSVPDPYSMPSGCPFHPRCQEKVGKVCEERMPKAVETGTLHKVRCFLYEKGEGE